MLNDLDGLKGWPEKVKLMQKNWIGKSYGCEINFEIENNTDKFINVFTTRPDTIFGATFIAISVDHPLSKKFEKNEDFINFKKECNKTGTTEEALIMLKNEIQYWSFCSSSIYKKRIPIFLQILF